jgi:hypothetical protein
LVERAGGAIDIRARANLGLPRRPRTFGRAWRRVRRLWPAEFSSQGLGAAGRSLRRLQPAVMRLWPASAPQTGRGANATDPVVRRIIVAFIAHHPPSWGCGSRRMSRAALLSAAAELRSTSIEASAGRLTYVAATWRSTRFGRAAHDRCGS